MEALERTDWSDPDYDCHESPRSRVLEARWVIHKRPAATRWLKRHLGKQEDVDAAEERVSVVVAALSRIDDEAATEGFDPPSAMAKAQATQLVEALSRRFPRHYDVYPTADREIAIDARGGPGRGVLVLVDSGGGASCFVTINGRNRRARYDDASCLPDSFINEALSDLG